VFDGGAGEINEAILLLSLCNGPREGGGFMVNPTALIDDGILNYTKVHQVGRLRMVETLVKVLQGHHDRCPDLKMGQFHNLEVTSDRPLLVQVDGEVFATPATNVRSLRVEILPGELELLGPLPDHARSEPKPAGS
jgi:diacylglycerol kinase (ATP)